MHSVYLQWRCVKGLAVIRSKRASGMGMSIIRSSADACESCVNFAHSWLAPATQSALSQNPCRQIAMHPVSQSISPLLADFPRSLPSQVLIVLLLLLLLPT